MIPILDEDRCTLLQGDAARIADVLPPESVDALVCDPPAGIGFMGKEWDDDKGGRQGWIAWLEGVMREALHVLKPGAHALVWAIPRTSHWTATALEQAGFEIRDVVVHLFGTGFPKSLNVGEGRGTALKPAAEHWILCRKPLIGTVAANVLEHGTGAINVDACRIGSDLVGGGGGAFGSAWRDGSGLSKGYEPRPVVGRWPANVVLDEEAAALLDAQSGPCGQLGRVAQKARHNDSGGASRFFYVAKPSRSERDAGCEHLPAKTGGEATDREDGSAGTNSPRAGAGRTGGARNFHPTVKSIALMRWLCRLITPPGGTVLDLFAGSGSTGVAALAEGFSFVGVERESDYIVIAASRLAHAIEHESEAA